VRRNQGARSPCPYRQHARQSAPSSPPTQSASSAQTPRKGTLPNGLVCQPPPSTSPNSTNTNRPGNSDPSRTSQARIGKCATTATSSTVDASHTQLRRRPCEVGTQFRDHTTRWRCSSGLVSSASPISVRGCATWTLGQPQASPRCTRATRGFRVNRAACLSEPDLRCAPPQPTATAI
jgi:hypothetical protein